MQVNSSHSNQSTKSGKGNNSGAGFVRLGLIFLLSFAYLSVQAQRINGLDAPARKILGEEGKRLAVPEERFVYLQQLQEKGYLLARLHALPDSGWSLQADHRFRWLSLSAGSVPEVLLKAVNYQARTFADKAFRFSQLMRLQQRIVAEANKRGYPFARLQLDSLTVENGVIHAELAYESGPFIVFDSLQLNKNAPLTPRFLQNRLGIRPGMPYNERKVQAVAQRLQSLPYVRLMEEPQLSFQNQSARLALALEKRSASRLDVLLALQNKPEGSGLLLTGQLDLALQNPFGGGKSLELSWRRLQEDAQQLRVAYLHPYPLAWPLLIEGNFQLQKEQELYLNRQAGLGLSFEAASADQYRLLFRRQVSELLAEGSGDSLTDLSLSSFGLGYARIRLDDLLLPSWGYRLELEALAGNKQYVLPSLLTEEQERENPQYSVGMEAEYVWALHEKLVWVHQLSGGGIFSAQLFTSDLLRLGGLQSLRGFREQAFFVRRYALSRGEIQLRWQNKSHLLLFYDQAWVQEQQASRFRTHYPLGLGAGLRLQVATGSFQLLYGLGFSRYGAVFPQNSQVHFGFVNRF